jgi:hypothetical protein
MTINWEQILRDRLQRYGHRNWLVIADSAYPDQCSPGVETIIADEEHIAVLNKVHAILSASGHVTATAYTDRELTYVREEDAPGITAYRETLTDLLKGFEVHTVPHETIIFHLDRAAEKFCALLIKTNMRIPYTSVFFQLECGYWNAKAEKRLRTAMRSLAARKRVNGRKSNLTPAHLQT